VILFCWSGHGLMDLTGYEKYFSGELDNFALPEEELQASVATLKGQPKAPARKTGKW
jgi:tryptophan synthase beta chain